ncbi:nucleosome assembly protein 1-like 3-like protein [Cricetulus griseus]|uniref:Nucleosome assembly protein 1-like 3-like protein n=1 Tax=Cricetulus griseus TaxID=10029 RepID=A0A061HXS1_CRIGR|nr:nucleosome assembly protein 1-like 3-like protein [Cricetulus griseus]
MGMGLGPIPKDMTDSEDLLWKASPSLESRKDKKTALEKYGLSRAIKAIMWAIHDLERKYAELNKPLYDKRFQIINAEYEPTEEECEWNSEEEFSGDEEMQNDTPDEMPPLEGEEEEEARKEEAGVKEEGKNVPNEVPDAKLEGEAPKESPEVKTEEKEIPKEVPEEKVEAKEASAEIPEVKVEAKEASEEIPEVKVEAKEASEEIPEMEAKEASEEIPEAKMEAKEASEEIPEVKMEEKEDPKEVPQANAENKDQPTEESKPRAPLREAQKRVPETRPERGHVKRARKGKPKREDPKGIPDYWLTVLKNVDKLGPMIQKYDEPILKFLSDVSLKFSTPGQPVSYTFEFHFLPNPYFRNELLMKTYIIRSKPDHYDPFFAWGWEIEECKGCKIDWRRGKDVTVTTAPGRPAATGAIEVQPRLVPNASFFNFFNPPEIPLIGKLEPREDAILDEDFEIGQILHDNVILKSIYYFTGEINDPYYHDVRDYGNRKYYK